MPLRFSLISFDIYYNTKLFNKITFRCKMISDLQNQKITNFMHKHYMSKNLNFLKL